MVSIKPNCTSNQVSSLHSSLDGTITPKSISECLSVPATADNQLSEAAITTTEKAQNAVTAPKSDFCVIGGLNAVKPSSASNPCFSGCTDGTCARLKRDKTVWFCSYSHDSTGDRDGFTFQEQVGGFGRFLNVEEAEAFQEVAAHFQAEAEKSPSAVLDTTKNCSPISDEPGFITVDVLGSTLDALKALGGNPKRSSSSHPCPICKGEKGGCAYSEAVSSWVCSIPIYCRESLSDEWLFQEDLRLKGERLSWFVERKSLESLGNEAAIAKFIESAKDTLLNPSAPVASTSALALPSAGRPNGNANFKPSSPDKPCKICKKTLGGCFKPGAGLSSWLCSTAHDATGDRGNFVFQEQLPEGFGWFVDVEAAENQAVKFGFEAKKAGKSDAESDAAIAAAIPGIIAESKATLIACLNGTRVVKNTGKIVVQASDFSADPLKKFNHGGSGNFLSSNASSPCPVCEDDRGKCKVNKKDPGHILCAGFPDTPKGNYLGKWLSGGKTKGGRWCSYRLSSSPDGWGTEQQSAYEDAKRELGLKLKVAAAESRAAKKSLTPEKRHEGYTQLIAELSFDRTGLQGRGLSDEELALLEKRGYRSLTKPYQKLSGSYHPCLPGIKNNTIQSPHLGYFCPTIQNGLITGYTIRKHDEIGGRYRWGSGGEGDLHLYMAEGAELPLNVAIPEKLRKHNQIGLVDSVAFKSVIAASRLGMPVIGAAGGMFAGSFEGLMAGLEESAIAMGLKIAKDISIPEAPPALPEIVIWLDAGAALKKECMMQWRIVEAQLADVGYLVVYAWYGQLKQEFGDIDEIDLAVTPIEFLSPEKMYTRIRKEEAKIVQVPMRTLSYPADLTITTRYLGEDLFTSGKVPLHGFVALRAPKDTGKSTSMRELIAHFKTMHKKTGRGYCVLSITPRITLGEAQAWDWKILWIGDKGRTTTIYESSEADAQAIDEYSTRIEQLTKEKLELSASQVERLIADDDVANRELAIASEIDELEASIEAIQRESFNHMGCCWDAIWKFSGCDMSNSLIIMDECETGITHLLTSKTCQSTRPAILKVFQKLIPDCLLGGGMVLLSDADLTNVSIDYIMSLMPSSNPIKPFVIRSDYKGAETIYRVDFRTGSRDGTLDEIVTRLLAGQRVIVTADNKLELQAIERFVMEACSEQRKALDLEAASTDEERQAIEARPALSLCTFLDSSGKISQEAQDGDPCIVRIDRDTTRYEPCKDFVKHCGKQILRWQPRLLLYSPSMGVGVSIQRNITRETEQGTIPYFDVVVGLYFGVIEPAQFRQQLTRFRANVPRIVWSRHAGEPEQGSSRSYFPDEVNAQTLRYQSEGALGILDVAKANLHEFAIDGRDGSDYDDMELLTEMNRLMAEWGNPKSRTFDNPHAIAYAKVKARRNLSRDYCQEFLLEELITDGHEVITLPNAKTGAGEIISALKEDIEIEESVALSEAKEIDESEADEIEKKGVKKSVEEQRSLTKFHLSNRLPEVALTPEFLLKASVHSEGKWLERQQLFYWLQNPDAVVQQDATEYLWTLKKGVYGAIYTPDFRPYNNKIKALKASGILDWIDLADPEKSYEGNSDKGRDCMQKAIANKSLIRSAFMDKRGIKISEKASPIALANVLLEDFGLALKKTTGMGKVVAKAYKLDPELLNDPDRIEALAGLERAWQRDTQQKAESAPRTVTYDINPVEPAEPATATQEDIGAECEVLIADGDFGTTHEPQAKWMTGYTLLELPSIFRDHYLLQDIYGAKTPAYEGGFRIVRSPERAESAALDLEKRCLAEVPELKEFELPQRYQAVERNFTAGLISEALLSRVLTAIGRAGEWFDSVTATEFPMMSG